MAKFTIELQDDTVKYLRELLTQMPQEGPWAIPTIEKLAVSLLGQAAMVVRGPSSPHMREMLRLLGHRPNALG